MLKKIYRTVISISLLSVYYLFMGSAFLLYLRYHSKILYLKINAIKLVEFKDIHKYDSLIKDSLIILELK